MDTVIVRINTVNHGRTANWLEMGARALGFLGILSLQSWPVAIPLLIQAVQQPGKVSVTHSLSRKNRLVLRYYGGSRSAPTVLQVL